VTLLVSALIAVAALACYLAILATWAIVHDPTISLIGRIVRILGAWLLPVAAAVSILRSAAELAPESLPSRRLLLPVGWLLRISPRRPNNLADETDNSMIGSPGRHDSD
jgi:hypothetical protein